jgi:hypothetical protein
MTILAHCGTLEPILEDKKVNLRRTPRHTMGKKGILSKVWKALSKSKGKE